ncbi:MAG: glucosaminidase domain-containing protein [Flavisolibacter sp.]
MKKLPLIFSFLLAGSVLFAQSPDEIRHYIATYKDLAIAEMQRTGVPAAITLAQGIHETGAGLSDLVKASNNHFGIKCKDEWKGETVYHDDDARGECFRKYGDPADSYRDHSDFLKNRPHYAFLFQLDPTDYEAWAYGLKKAGYATNPKYPQILINLIRQYDLEDYTLIALNRKPADDNIVLARQTENGAARETKPVNAVGILPAVNYPSGVFRINETKVVFASKGTSYLKLATENDLSLSRLFDFNDLKGMDIALVDQLVFLQRKRKKGATEFHIVTEGETLHDIAQKEGIRLESLLGYNSLQEDMHPRVGEKLYLQQKAPSMPLLETPASTTSLTPPVEALPSLPSKPETFVVVHTVQARETMYAIARKYDVAVEEVMKWNDLQTTDLKPGQQLRINKKRTNATN